MPCDAQSDLKDDEGCPECGQPVPDHARDCVVCHAHVGFPNVRAANKSVEFEALTNRFDDAMKSARAIGCEQVANHFEQVVQHDSRVVINKSFEKTLAWLKGEHLTSFYNQVSSNARIPENNKWDRGRGSIDSLLFPHFREQMVFGALALNELGVPYYGAVSISLKEEAISSRSTVFEENSYKFAIKHRVVVGTELPHGYVAPWDRRGILAVAKNVSKFGVDTNKEEFPNLLVSMPGDQSEDGDFVEVHIYGEVSPLAIEEICIVGTLGRDEEKLLKKAAKKNQAKIAVSGE